MPTATPIATTTERAGLLRLLAEPTRLLLLELLARGPATVTELTHKLGCRQPAASHHLGLLRMNKAVVAERAGKRVVYRLAPGVSVMPKWICFPQGVSISR